ncbi:zinc finger BED domain-containing protein RICESLEEPER 1-like [Prunus dulcis]|uniref:zinc finger BED domain-containing protein RICESLEEPER 1-like n=1 Tax=Prunus dulcis TaxID=3755 RepID=UPI001483AE51|nr:zinc finger BED domain-containing protein RICESLEEPER 1-like [Prunus dulcis]
MDTFDGVSESAEGGVGVGEVRNNVVDSDPSNNNNAVVTQIGKRRRKLTSAVWTQFEILPIDENNEQRAKCMKCGQKYLCDSRYGTGNLKRHIESCVKTDTRDLGQLLLSKSDGAILTRSSKFDPMKFRELLVMAIIMHDLPFQFVEYAGIRQLFNYVCADIKLVSRNTAKADVLSLYNREKSKLKEILGSVPGRKRILNFSFMPPPHTGVALCEKIYRLLTDWGVEKKLFSMTLDNASSNDTFVELLKGQLNLKDALLMNGKFFHIRCCAHILNLIVQDGLKHIDDSVGKIRESIKYVRGSQGRKQKFLNCAAQVSLECKRGLRQDVPTRWNSTFLMIDSALYYQRAFLHLQLSDSNYKHSLSQDEWVKLEKLSKFLKVFYDVTCLFSGTKYPTANLYFPQVFVVEDTLRKAKVDSDSFMKSMATQMMEKFDKYWKEYSLILAIAVILDPRYKIQFVEFCYKRLYGYNSEEMTKVRDMLFSLFDLYFWIYSSYESVSGTSSASNGARPHVDDMVSKECLDVMKEFDNFESEEFTTSAQKTQLQLYLDEPKIDRKTKLNVLDFWKVNQFRYPELSILARDLLSILISTVASESAFSVGGRVLDQYRSALKPENVEALVCTRDWIFGEENCTLAPNLEELTEDISKMEINATNSAGGFNTVTPGGQS